MVCLFLYRVYVPTCRCCLLHYVRVRVGDGGGEGKERKTLRGWDVVLRWDEMGTSCRTCYRQGIWYILSFLFSFFVIKFEYGSWLSDAVILGTCVLLLRAWFGIIQPCVYHRRCMIHTYDDMGDLRRRQNSFTFTITWVGGWMKGCMMRGGGLGLDLNNIGTMWCRQKKSSSRSKAHERAGNGAGGRGGGGGRETDDWHTGCLWYMHARGGGGVQKYNGSSKQRANIILDLNQGRGQRPIYFVCIYSYIYVGVFFCFLFSLYAKIKHDCFVCACRMLTFLHDNVCTHMQCTHGPTRRQVESQELERVAGMQGGLLPHLQLSTEDPSK